MTDLQRQFYDMLMRSQYWSAERMQEHQRSQLSQLLLHAQRTVPFYAHRLDAVLRPDGTVDWDRWTDIPILTRADLQMHGAAMQATALPPGHGLTFVRSSSGSTGQPVNTTQVALTAVANDAAMARSHAWRHIDYSKGYVNITGDDPSKAAWPDGEDRQRWGPPYLEASGPSHRIHTLASPAQQVDFLQRRSPAYLAAVTSRARAVAIEVLRQGTKLPLEAVITRAEGVPASTQELFQRAFGAQTVQTYACEEAGRIAHDCDRGSLHINAEVVLLEIVDEDGATAPTGKRGRVILTPFYNTGQPLIRYEVGDLASLGTTCECGMNLPVLEPVAGRISQLFELPDGRRFLPNVGDYDMVGLGVGSWQLAQVSPTTAEFRYVAADPGAPPSAVDLLRVLKGGIQGELDIMLRPMAALPPARKHISYRNELARD